MVRHQAARQYSGILEYRREDEANLVKLLILGESYHPLEPAPSLPQPSLPQLSLPQRSISMVHPNPTHPFSSSVETQPSIHHLSRQSASRRTVPPVYPNLLCHGHVVHFRAEATGRHHTDPHTARLYRLHVPATHRLSQRGRYVQVSPHQRHKRNQEGGKGWLEVTVLAASQLGCVSSV